MAGERHGHGMLCVNRPLLILGLVLRHVANRSIYRRLLSKIMTRNKYGILQDLAEDLLRGPASGTHIPRKSKNRSKKVAILDIIDIDIFVY
jgi:hypothetical protein